MGELTYTVPFFHAPDGSKIVIYGGGKWGEYFFRKIKQSACAEIVAILDAQAPNLPKIFGATPVYKPDKICELKFDYVYIAVEAKEHAADIKHLLQGFGISEDKILWGFRQSCLDRNALREILKCFERNIESESRRFFLFMLPEHGNLGDYAIGYAEFSFFKQYFGQYEVYGVTTSEWLAASEWYLEIIRPNDVIFLNGGGFLGDLWEDAKIYRHIVMSFPRNIKIFFPNSFTYQENPGKENKTFKKDMEWFGRQENLFVFFREYPSYCLYNTGKHVICSRTWFFICTLKEMYFKKEIECCYV